MVKDQGQIYDFLKKLVSAVDHEWLVRLVSNFADRLSVLLSICSISVKVI